MISAQVHMIYASLPPRTAFPLGLIAGARPRLVYTSRCCGSTRSARTRPAHGLDVGISAQSCPVSDLDLFVTHSPHMRYLFLRAAFECVILDRPPPP